MFLEQLEPQEYEHCWATLSVKLVKRQNKKNVYELFFSHIPTNSVLYVWNAWEKSLAQKTYTFAKDSLIKKWFIPKEELENVMNEIKSETTKFFDNLSEIYTNVA